MSYVAKVLPASLTAFVLCAWAGVLPAHAQIDTGVLEDVGGTAGLADADLPTVLGRILGIALGLLGVVFLVLMLYAGFLWMTAGGNDEKVGKAKKLITQAIIGLILTVAAYAISGWVVDNVITAVQ